MHMSSSALDPRTPAEVARLPGVAWAEGIRYATTFVVNPRGDQQLSYVIGYDPATGRGGPHHFSAGRAPGRGEIALEQIAADRLGLHLGDTVNVFNDSYRLVGLFHGGTTIANSIAFITTDDFAAHRGDPVAYVLIGAKPGVSANQLAARVAAVLPGDTVQTRAQFTHQEAALVKDMSADLMRIMSTVGLLIALAVIALTLFSLTLAKLREHAIVKALGGRTRRLVAVVLAQAAWLVAVALLLATTAAIVLGKVVGQVSPSVAVAIEPASVLRIAVSAAMVGAVGALIPLRRVVSVDPASAFRRES
jgi:putative ABC transport system permease protein